MKRRISKIPRTCGDAYNFFYDGVHCPGDGVTQSLLGGYLNCRQWAAFRTHRLCYASPSFALMFGNGWHWILEACYDAVREQGAVYEWGQLIDEFVEQMDPSGAHPSDVEKGLAFAEALYDPYWDYWAEDMDVDWVAVESEFDVPYQFAPRSDAWTRLRGKRDGLVRRNGKLWLLETKTCSRLGSKGFDDTLTFSFQNLYYLFAATLEAGEPIAGVLYNQVRKPQLRQGKNETFQAYAERCRVDIADNPENYFQRLEIIYTKQRQRQFVADLRLQLDELSRWCLGDVPTFKNTRACSGLWTCDYLSACASCSTAGFVNQTGPFHQELSE